MKTGKIRIVIETPNVLEISKAGIAKLKARYAKSILGRVKVKVSVIKGTVAAAMLLAMFSLSAAAQTAPAPAQVAALPPTFIKGEMDIKFDTVSQPVVKGKTKDVYTLDINVANSARFYGTVTDQPQIIEGTFNKAVTQPRMLAYDITCDVINPANPAQRKANVGTLHGNVPISSDGTYQYDKGTFQLDILTGTPHTSRFLGLAYGKPLVRPPNWEDTLRAQVNILRRNKDGSTAKVVLTRYDKMDFRNCVLADGPSGNYSQVTCNGEMLYDYSKKCWFFNNFSMQYAENGNIRMVPVTGTIRYLQPNKQSVDSEYDFDIRVSEPLPSEAQSFASTSSDESSFFSTDNSIPSLVGTMKYHDTRTATGETAASHVVIDLTGNNLSRQQTMALAKAIIFNAIVPMNSD